MRRLQRNLIRTGFALGLGSICFQFGGCFNIALSQLNQLNPCTTVLACDPTVFEFARSNTQPGVNDDPFCTVPPYCTTAQDPLFGGLAP